MTGRYLAVNGLNLLIVTLMAVAGISLGKVVFTRWYVKGLSELFGAV